MANRLPDISDKHKVCIICEGNEEYKYLERLNCLHVWNDIYDILLLMRKEMATFLLDIRIDTRMGHMKLFLYSVILRRSLMSSMKISSAR